MDTIQEGRHTFDRILLCTREFEGLIYIRLTCTTLAFKLLELDAGDVLKRLAECCAWGESKSDQPVRPKKDNRGTTHVC